MQLIAAKAILDSKTQSFDFEKEMLHGTRRSLYLRVTSPSGMLIDQSLTVLIDLSL